MEARELQVESYRKRITRGNENEKPRDKGMLFLDKKLKVKIYFFRSLAFCIKMLKETAKYVSLEDIKSSVKNCAYHS